MENYQCKFRTYSYLANLSFWEPIRHKSMNKEQIEQYKENTVIINNSVTSMIIII